MNVIEPLSVIHVVIQALNGKTPVVPAIESNVYLPSLRMTTNVGTTTTAS